MCKEIHVFSSVLTNPNSSKRRVSVCALASNEVLYHRVPWKEVNLDTARRSRPHNGSQTDLSRSC
eukprot:1300417-Amphidinium_carterae.1